MHGKPVAGLVAGQHSHVTCGRACPQVRDGHPTSALAHGHSQDRGHAGRLRAQNALLTPDCHRTVWHSPRQHTSASSSAPHSSARLTVVLTSQPCAPGRRGERRDGPASVGGSRAASGCGHAAAAWTQAAPRRSQPRPMPVLLRGVSWAHAHFQKRRAFVHANAGPQPACTTRRRAREAGMTAGSAERALQCVCGVRA